MNNKCCKDHDNKLIINNKHIFDYIHQKKSSSLINYNVDPDNFIYVPVTINICLKESKYNIDFLKYCKYIINTLNDGFSGNISCLYKNDIYNLDYFKSLFTDDFDEKSNKYASQIYNYINNCTDTKIKFLLKSIEYFNKNFEIEFKNNDTELLINNFFKSGFYIRDENKLNLNINIINFKCSTLGVATFPWMRYIIKVPHIMMIFLNFSTIHPDISKNSYNQCRTLIHEAGHVFGLRHTFNNDKESHKVYKILLGKIIYDKEFRENIIKNNNIDNSNYVKKSNKINDVNFNLNEINYVSKKINHDHLDKQLYIDIPYQEFPTVIDPIDKHDFQINQNDEIINFACFMDYSPDSVLTHFTESQKRIMLYFIRIFLPYLLKKNSINNDNYTFNLNLYNGLTIDEKTNKIKEENLNIDNYFYKNQIKFIDEFNYQLIINPKNIMNLSFNNSNDNVLNILNELMKKIK